MERQMNKEFKVVRVTKTEYELENGSVYPLPFELDVIPSVEEFEVILHKSKQKLQEIIEGVNNGR
jgi:hypothetical protein